MLSETKHLGSARRSFADAQDDKTSPLRMTIREMTSGGETEVDGALRPMMNFNKRYRSFCRCRCIGQRPVDALFRPINRRCANKLCAYETLPSLLVKIHHRLEARYIGTYEIGQLLVYMKFVLVCSHQICELQGSELYYLRSF